MEFPPKFVKIMGIVRVLFGLASLSVAIVALTTENSTDVARRILCFFVVACSGVFLASGAFFLVHYRLSASTSTQRFRRAFVFFVVVVDFVLGPLAAFAVGDDGKPNVVVLSVYIFDFLFVAFFYLGQSRNGAGDREPFQVSRIDDCPAPVAVLAPPSYEELFLKNDEAPPPPYEPVDVPPPDYEDSFSCHLVDKIDPSPSVVLPLRPLVPEH